MLIDVIIKILETFKRILLLVGLILIYIVSIMFMLLGSIFMSQLFVLVSGAATYMTIRDWD